MPKSRGRPPDRKPKTQHTAIESVSKEQPKLSPPHPLEQNTPAPASEAGRPQRILGRMIGSIIGCAPQLLLWASALMTLVAGAFYFLPRITVEPSGLYDPKSPSPIIFTIGNVNIVPLRDVQPVIGVCYITGIGVSGGPECNGPAATVLAFKPWFTKWLDVDEKYQIAIEDALRPATPDKQGQQIENANVTIGIMYTPWRMPAFWRITKQFRFVTKKLSDGKIYWTSTPLNR
jgi:hypothetical protein